MNRSWGVTRQGYDPCNQTAGSTAAALGTLNKNPMANPIQPAYQPQDRASSPFLFKIINFELHRIPQQINTQDLKTMHRQRGPKAQIFEDPFFVGLLNQVHSIV